MQPKLKAGGIRLRIRFLHLHVIINGKLHVIALTALPILVLTLMDYRLAVWLNLVVHSDQELRSQLVIANDKIMKI